MKRLTSAVCAMILVLTLSGGCGQAPAEEVTVPQTTAPTAAPQETAAAIQTEAAETMPPETTEPVPVFAPAMTDSSNPDNWGIQWEIIQNGTVVESYTREEEIFFGEPESYFSLPGIATFRGNNYRNGATYGTANVTQESINRSWRIDTSAITSYDGTVWAGSGWTGQPLIVQWDEETKQIMNLYEEKKAKENLVEVIYATLGGMIYFLDLEDGSYTRDPLWMDVCFKGAGALDPRGYPLLYVGSGDMNADYVRPRMYVISLIDTSILYEYGHEEPMQLRTDNSSWCAFDSSPLVHGDTDTLIWPGENGILYTIKLNTAYDKAAGTLSISPEHTVATRYHTARSGSDDYWYGYEASAAIVENYLYVSENGGMMYCVDLNTMALVWAQDTLDDSNSSPVFEWISEEEAYIYTAPSLHWTTEGKTWGDIHIYKLNALTGEIVWQIPYEVATMDGVSGGVQATGLLGKAGSTIDGMIIYPIARQGALYSGILVALNTETGEEVWRTHMPLYSWSSPVAVYNEDGTAYVVIGDAEGTLMLLNGATGEILAEKDIYSIVEASPAVFGNKLVVGTRGYMIHCLTID